ncbi:MAG: methyltransferase [Pseudomonadota bacterium]
MDALADAYNTGLHCEKAGDIDGAETAYRKCLELDPTDTCGARIRLASLGRVDPPSAAPAAYVKTLFDQHAEDFDYILTDQLKYAVPMQIAEFLRRRRAQPFQRLLDLGCGTGLVGLMLGDMVEQAIGVDLSDQILDKADERAVYDELFENEAVHFLEEYPKAGSFGPHAFDLIVAADVFPYIGDLKPFFDAVQKNAGERAVLAVSCETLPATAFGSRGWSITAHQRYAHHEQYLRNLMENAGFVDTLLFETIQVRLEQGRPIPGYLAIAARN